MWRDDPKGYGPQKILHSQFVRWSRMECSSARALRRETTPPISWKSPFAVNALPYIDCLYRNCNLIVQAIGNYIR